jgi:hypothetical protein
MAQAVPELRAKLNGWKRIGIVASVVWILGAGLYTLKATSDADLRDAASIYSDCAAVRDERWQRQSEYCAKQDDYNACNDDFRAKNPDKRGFQTQQR